MSNYSCILGSHPDTVSVATDEELQDWVTYVPERTCHKVIPNEMEGYVYCSECGAEIGEYGYPRFCHNCGSKVVG